MARPNDTMTQLLGEKEGTVLVADLVRFADASKDRDPAEIGLYLTNFYVYVCAAIEAHGGRIVKFLGDGLLAVFFDANHRGKALAATAELARDHDQWIEQNARARLPRLDYTIGLSSGEVLEGELGTDHVIFYDVIGETVNNAFKLCALAASRGIHHLIDGDVIARATPGAGAASATEVEGAELHGTQHRLYRVAVDANVAAAPGTAEA